MCDKDASPAALRRMFDLLRLFANRVETSLPLDFQTLKFHFLVVELEHQVADWGIPHHQFAWYIERILYVLVRPVKYNVSSAPEITMLRRYLIDRSINRVYDEDNEETDRYKEDGPVEFIGEGVLTDLSDQLLNVFNAQYPYSQTRVPLQARNSNIPRKDSSSNTKQLVLPVVSYIAQITLEQRKHAHIMVSESLLSKGAPPLLLPSSNF